MRTTVLRVVVASLAFLAGSAFAQAARVVDLQGTASARVVPMAAAGQAAPAPGPARNLRMGDTVSQGETISTGAKGVLILTFTDGQVVMLSPGTRFKIETYTYNSKKPELGRIHFSLEEGGLRTVTGLIGKAQPKNVTLRAEETSVSVLGTDFTFSNYGKQVVVSVEAGNISVTYAGRTLTIPAGSGTYIDMKDPSKPILRLSKSDLNSLLQQMTKVTNQLIQESTMKHIDAAAGLTGSAFLDATSKAFADEQALIAGLRETSSTLSSARNAGGIQGSGSGGGSALPNCSLISPVSARQPNVNCVS